MSNERTFSLLFSGKFINIYTFIHITGIIDSCFCWFFLVFRTKTHENGTGVMTEDRMSVGSDTAARQTGQSAMDQNGLLFFPAMQDRMPYRHCSVSAALL